LWRRGPQETHESLKKIGRSLNRRQLRASVARPPHFCNSRCILRRPATAEAERWSGRRRASAAQLTAFGRQNWKVVIGERLNIRALATGSLPLWTVFSTSRGCLETEKRHPVFPLAASGSLGRRRRWSGLKAGGFRSLPPSRPHTKARRTPGFCMAN